MPGTSNWSEIKHKRESNILDPPHAELPPTVWDNAALPEPTLKPEHVGWIEREVYTVLEQAGYTLAEQWLSLYLTGSLTTYQYSDESDVDVSLFVDTDKFPDWSRAEMIGLMVGKMDGRKLPGTPYHMQCFVVGPGIKPEDLYKEGLRSGYNLDTNNWLVPPDRNRIYNVEIDQNGFFSYALQQADKMEKLLRYEPLKAHQFYHQLHAKRQRDQRLEKGDNAESNIIFKFLDKRGLLPEFVQKPGDEKKPEDEQESAIL